MLNSVCFFQVLLWMLWQGELQFEKQRSLDFVTQLQTVESERNLLQRQLEESVLQIQSLSDDLNQSRSQSLQEVATLRKSLESSTMERDAAIVSRVCWLSLSVLLYPR
jgi:predicted  nucleic acid-binding Zn-ribbon protein